MEQDPLEIHILEECSDMTQNYEEVVLQEKKENVVIVDDFILKKENIITISVDTQTELFEKYWEWTTSNNIGRIANLKNETSVSTSFATYEQRNQKINELYNQVMEKKYQGVCIDFKEIDDVNSFYRFLIELSPKFKESGLKVIVKINAQLDKEKVKNIVDFMIE